MLEVNYQAERRQHTEARRAVFVVPPSWAQPGVAARLHRVHDADGRHLADQIGAIADYWSKYELGWHVSPTQNHRDAIATVEIALAETLRLLGRPLLDSVTDPDTGVIQPVAVVTDNGPCFKSGKFATFIDRTPS